MNNIFIYIIEIKIIYNNNIENKIKIFDSEFAKKNISKIKYLNKEYKLIQNFEIYNNNAEIIYKEINNIINTNYMIDNCSSLSSLSYISNCKYNTIRI